MGKLQIVVGGQFGSEGKGAVAGHLAREDKRTVAVRVAGPNAGHSAIDDWGRKWALRQIPVAGVTNLDAPLVIGAGSEIDEEVLHSEIMALEEAGIPVWQRLYVDNQATIIDQHHKDDEAELTGRLGSTAKGIGAARAARAMRTATLWGHPQGENEGLGGVHGCDTQALLRNWLHDGRTVMLEGTQGYGLGLHAGYYPFCTSSNCTAVDFAAMAGVTPWDPVVNEVETWVTLRTYPIRVAGNSGPLQGEVSWDYLAQTSRGHIGEERTTVTQKVRRVGTWDPDLARAAVAANGGGSVSVALTFLDYWFPELAGATRARDLKGEHAEAIVEVEKQVGAPVKYVGTGPDTCIWL